MAENSARPGAENPDEEIDRFHQSVSDLSREIEQSVADLESESLPSEARIMQAHLTMLQDRGFHRRVHELVRDRRYAAEAAVEHALHQTAAKMRASGRPVLAERAADFEDLALRLKAQLGLEGLYDLEAELQGTKGAVLALQELLPSVVLEARSLGVAGFIVERGTRVSHGAILARSFGMAAVRIPSLSALEPFGGQEVLVDGRAGKVMIAPSAKERTGRIRPSLVPAAGRADHELPARLWASIVDPAQLEGLDWSDIEGVGLYRTEMLFLQHRHDFPGEQEQIEVYQRLFELAGGRPVVVRTADLGADKMVEHMSFGPQGNPSLGLRAHRLYRFHPEILVTQIRAILRAATGCPGLRIMFPLIETIDQWQFVQELVNQARASLQRDRLTYQADFAQGILIETPAAAWRFARFLKAIDFASIGTNDLVQYLFAVEREAANVEDLYLPEHPVVLEVLATLADQARLAGKPLSLCGEIAGDPILLPVLIGLGIGHLSVSVAAIGRVHQRLQSLDVETCRRMAEACKNADTAEEVRTILGQSRSDSGSGVAAAGLGQALDPMCGMVVSVKGNPHVLRTRGGVHYFCSSRCATRFLAARGPTDVRSQRKTGYPGHGSSTDEPRSKGE